MAVEIIPVIVENGGISVLNQCQIDETNKKMPPPVTNFHLIVLKFIGRKARP
jgi:hypothetical protein